MNQRFATVSTILAVLEERGVTYELNGPTPISEVLNDSDKKSIRDALFAMFRSNQVEMADDSKAKYTDDKALKAYVSGLVNNWVRKAPEFNGSATYQAKNPGSRAGSADAQIAEMKKLLKSVTDEATRQVIQGCIDARLQEIKPQTTIDSDKLPESLRYLVA